MTSHLYRTAAAAALLFLSSQSLDAQREAAPPSPSAKAQLFDNVLRQIRDRYVDSISPDELYDVAARAVVKHLNDRYTGLLEGQSANMWAFGGIGAMIDARDSIRVISLFPNSPAAGADVRPGDRIIEVAGKSTAGWMMEQIVNALRGEVGTPVELTLRRTGMAEPIRLTLTRAKIEMVAVRPGVMLNDSVGYIAFDAITPTAAGELEAQISALKAKGMRALILDLRSNGGGAIDQSVNAANLFLDAGREIASTRGRSFGMNVQYSDDSDQTWPDLPVVVLVSPRTASGAEILTGALQDNDRAVVIGSSTYGKGVGQSQDWLDERTALRLTTLRWYTPTGRNINRMVDDTVPSSVAKESSDSAIRARPLAATIGKRAIRGGRGIVPDIVVQPTAAEWAFIEASGYDTDRLAGVVARVALDIRAAGTVTTRDFPITNAMRTAVEDQLRRLQPGISPKILTALRPIIDQRLRHDITYHVFGAEAALAYDAQVAYATELLRRARTPSELLREGTTDQGYRAVTR